MMSKTTGERGMSKMTRPKTFRCARGLHPETYSVMIAKFRNLLEEVLMRKVSLILLALAVSVGSIHTENNGEAEAVTTNRSVSLTGKHGSRLLVPCP